MVSQAYQALKVMLVLQVYLVSKEPKENWDYQEFQA